MIIVWHCTDWWTSFNKSYYKAAKYSSTRLTSVMLTLQRENVTVVVNIFPDACCWKDRQRACLPPHQRSLCTLSQCHHCTLTCGAATCGFLDIALCTSTMHTHNSIHTSKGGGDCVFGCFLKSRDQVACDALMMAACFYLLLSPFLNYVIFS